MKRMHIIVEGRVQGINLRYHTRKKASELDIRGYVKNLPDGTVEIVAEGEENKLKELVEFCRSSPGASHVTKVKLSLEDAQDVFDRFMVEY